jgi:thiol:disulfide interchange protein DsbC
VTVHVFLLPILSADSTEKSKAVWCSKDKAKAWTDMMLQSKNIPAGSCDTSALTRNVEFAKKNRITGTPTVIFADGTRVPGAISAQQVEKYLAEAKAL